MLKRPECEQHRAACRIHGGVLKGEVLGKEGKLFPSRHIDRGKGDVLLRARLEIAGVEV